MLCLACAMPGHPLCGSCVASLRWSSPIVDGALSAEAPFRHTGAAVRLVHNLKYRRSLPAGRLLAAAMLQVIPSDATALVPLPRSLGRRVLYGIDQASFLASELSKLTSLPSVNALRAPLWWKRQAGVAHMDRHGIAFTMRAAPDDGAVLIDDVLTTGATAWSAAAALGLLRFSLVVASSASTMETGTRPFPSRGGGVTQMRAWIDNQPRVAQPASSAQIHTIRSAVSARPDRPNHREETE